MSHEFPRRPSSAPLRPFVRRRAAASRAGWRRQTGRYGHSRFVPMTAPVRSLQLPAIGSALNAFRPHPNAEGMRPGMAGEGAQAVEEA